MEPADSASDGVGILVAIGRPAEKNGRRSKDDKQQNQTRTHSSLPAPVVFVRRTHHVGQGHRQARAANRSPGTKVREETKIGFASKSGIVNEPGQ